MYSCIHGSILPPARMAFLRKDIKGRVYGGDIDCLLVYSR